MDVWGEIFEVALLEDQQMAEGHLSAKKKYSRNPSFS